MGPAEFFGALFFFSHFSFNLSLRQLVFFFTEKGHHMTTTPGSEKASAAEVQARFEAFQAFDTAADAEASAPPPQSLDEAKGRIADLVGHLPQFASIADAPAGRWIDRTFEMAQQRMVLEKGEARIADMHAHVLWHARRASGIGGSESSTVLKHYRGERGTFGDAHNLTLEKLLVMAPQSSTPEMSRGVRAEPWLQKMYQVQNDAVSDDEGLRRLKGFRWTRRPAMIGTPDDLVILPDGKRKILDYKAPSADVMADYERNGISFDYVCQLHHYAILAMAAGVKFDSMEIQAFDPRSFQLVTFEVPFDKALAAELVQSCHNIWFDHVMGGLVPEAPRPDVLNVEDEAVIALGVQASMLKAIEDDTKKKREDLISRISILGSEWHDLATGKLDLAVASFNRLRKWDEEGLKSLATAASVELAPFYKTGKELDKERSKSLLETIYAAIHEGRDTRPILEDFYEKGMPLEAKLDADALAAHLEDLGISTITAAQVQERFTMTTKKKGPEYDRLVVLRDHVGALMEQIEQVVIEVAPQVILGEPEQEPLPEMDAM